MHDILGLVILIYQKQQLNTRKDYKRFKPFEMYTKKSFVCSTKSIKLTRVFVGCLFRFEVFFSHFCAHSLYFIFFFLFFYQYYLIDFGFPFLSSHVIQYLHKRMFVFVCSIVYIVNVNI